MGTTGPFPMPMAMPTLVFPSDPPPVWIPSPRGLTQWPRELFRLPTTTARGPLTPTLPLLPPFPSETRLAWTPSPRALMSPPRDTFPMPMVSTDTISATLDTTTARGLLMLRLTPTTLVAMLFLGFPLDTLPAWSPSPRALMPPPRVTIPMPMATSATMDTILATSATTTVKFRELTRHVC